MSEGERPNDELFPIVTRTVTVTEEIILPWPEMERRAIDRALRICDWNAVRAAEALGLGKATVYRKIKKYGIRRPPPPSGA